MHPLFFALQSTDRSNKTDSYRARPYPAYFSEW